MADRPGAEIFPGRIPRTEKKRQKGRRRVKDRQKPRGRRARQDQGQSAALEKSRACLVGQPHQPFRFPSGQAAFPEKRGGQTGSQGKPAEEPQEQDAAALRGKTGEPAAEPVVFPGKSEQDPGIQQKIRQDHKGKQRGEDRAEPQVNALEGGGGSFPGAGQKKEEQRKKTQEIFFVHGIRGPAFFCSCICLAFSD